MGQNPSALLGQISIAEPTGSPRAWPRPRTSPVWRAGRVADRGFGDHKLYRVLSEELKFDFVIRFRGNIAVTATDGEMRAAADWVGAGGRARTLRGAAVTAQAYPVATVVCVRAKGM